jgi:hypothetical protein
MNTVQENKIAQATEYHQKAMDLAEAAFVAQVRGELPDEAVLRQAFALERQAAELVASEIDFEPSRSVLHRSAAALAIDCREYRAAEQLICAALAGNPPEEIADELRDLLQQVYSHLRK